MVILLVVNSISSLFLFLKCLSVTSFADFYLNVEVLGLPSHLQYSAEHNCSEESCLKCGFIIIIILFMVYLLMLSVTETIQHL
jgi:hypothetical protein